MSMLVLQLVAPITPDGRLLEVDRHHLSWPIGLRAWKRPRGGRWEPAGRWDRSRRSGRWEHAGRWDRWEGDRWDQWIISIDALTGRKIAGFKGRCWWTGWVGDWETTPCGRAIIIRLRARTVAIKRSEFTIYHTNIRQKCLTDEADADDWNIVFRQMQWNSAELRENGWVDALK